MGRPAKGNPRKCVVCDGSARLVSLAVKAYVKGLQGLSGTMVICESCLLDDPLSRKAEVVGRALRGASQEIYKRLRGVS